MTDPLAAVRAHLEKSSACAREASALVERAISLRDAAYDLLPLGARLRFDGNLVTLVLEKRPDGWWGVTEEFTANAEDDWVRENWGRNNWLLVEEDDRG